LLQIIFSFEYARLLKRATETKRHCFKEEEEEEEEEINDPPTNKNKRRIKIIHSLLCCVCVFHQYLPTKKTDDAKPPGKQ